MKLLLKYRRINSVFYQHQTTNKLSTVFSVCMLSKAHQMIINFHAKYDETTGSYIIVKRGIQLVGL